MIKKSPDTSVYEQDYEFKRSEFSASLFLKRQAGKFAYEAIVQKCKRLGNLFARDQLEHKVREDEL